MFYLFLFSWILGRVLNQIWSGLSASLWQILTTYIPKNWEQNKTESPRSDATQESR